MTYEADEVREALVLAQRIRIAELEMGLHDVLLALSGAERRLCEVMRGAGASLDEQLVGSAAIAAVRAVLRRAMERPTQPTEPDASCGGRVIDLGARIKRRTST